MTNTTQHVPGPYSYGWDKDGCNDNWYIFPASDPNHFLAGILFWDCDADEMDRTEAQARLFAAAPELLETLKTVLELAGKLPINTRKNPLNKAIFQALQLVARTEGRV